MDTFLQPIIELLRDSVWQGISGLVAIAAFGYFLYDRYANKENLTAGKIFIKKVFWIDVFWFTFGGLVSFCANLADGFKWETFFIGWVIIGTLFSVVTIFIEIQDSLKK